MLLPKSGPLTSYNVTLIDSQSNQTLSHELIANPVTVFEHTFVDLDPETSYRVNVVGINQYGAGNRTVEPLKITTAAPQGQYGSTNVYFKVNYCFFSLNHSSRTTSGGCYEKFSSHSNFGHMEGKTT